MLGLTFANEADYEKIQEDDTIDIVDLTSFAPDKQLTLVLRHKNGTTDTIKVNHTYNAGQIEWFKAGSALNLIAKEITSSRKSAVKKSKPSGKKKAAKKVIKKAAKKSAKKAGKKTKAKPKKAVKKSKKSVKKKKR
jgi:aconitate hydratase